MCIKQPLEIQPAFWVCNSTMEKLDQAVTMYIMLKKLMTNFPRGFEIDFP